MSSTRILTASVFALMTTSTAAFASAQSQGIDSFRRETARALTAKPRTEEPSTGRSSQAVPTDYVFKSRKDSLDWASKRNLAFKSTGFRVVVSLQERHLWVITDDDTLLSAPAAVAKGSTLTYGGMEKTFDTPRGLRNVRAKDADPIWNPPNWLYYETAAELGLKVREIPAKGLTMPDGRRLVITDNKVGVIDSQGPSNFDPALHIIFGQTLYIPPIGTENRKVNGTLGKYKLDLGEGYLFHGTNIPTSIGLAATHGCIRLRDEDIEWLYDNIPVGTKVYIY